MTVEDLREEWRPLEGTRYLVSNHGRVYAYPAHRKCCPGKGGERYRLVPARIYKGNISPPGYKRVNIDGKPTHVHRLVAMLFLEDYSDDLTVNHKDGNKINNRVTNLECISNSENVKHAWETGLMDHAKAVICNETGATYSSLHEAASAMGKAVGNLCSHLKGRQKTFAGYTWSYSVPWPCRESQEAA